MTGTVLMFILPTVAILLILLAVGSHTDQRHEEDPADHPE